MAITLKSARVNVNLTQAQAAKLIGITVDTLSNYERGNHIQMFLLLRR